MVYRNAGNKAVKKELREHIMDCLGFETVKELKDQVDYIRCPRMYNIKDIADYMVDGGCFLIYHDDVRKFMNDELRIKPAKSDELNWDRYRSLISLQVKRMLIELSQGKSDNYILYKGGVR